MAKLAVINLGCPKNTVLSNQLKYSLLANNHQLVPEEEAEYVIVNTCGFIQEAQEISIETLLNLFQGNRPKRKIIATGCLVDLYQKELAKALPEVDVFLKTSELTVLQQLLGSGTFELKKQYLHNSSYAFLKIAEGCDLQCAFCLIPQIKGKFKSRPYQEILQEAEYLYQQGVKELVIVSQDTGRYGWDIYGRYCLDELLQDLAKIKFKRLRVMYLQPQYLNQKLVKRLAEIKTICAYLDIPIQHASSKILRAMQRAGNKQTYAKIIADLRSAFKQRFYWRTSILLGFPGEKRPDFQELLQFLKEAQPDYVGIFAFSPQPGTRAAKLTPTVDKRTVQNRVETARKVADEISFNSLQSWLGQQVEVLIDKADASSAIARSYFQAPEIDGEVYIKLQNGQKALKAGDIVKVKLESLSGYDFTGSVTSA